MAIAPAHCRRLRDVFRSAGWLCHDALQIELLAGGLLQRVALPSGHEALRVTDAGIAPLGDTGEARPPGAL